MIKLPDFRKMRLSGLLQIAVIAILLAITFFFTRTPGKDDVIERSSLAGPATEGSVRQVQVIRPSATVTVPRIEATGSMIVRSYVMLSPQVSGRVTHVSDSLRAGGSFSASDVLLTIEPNDFELNLAQARADVASAEATLKLRQAESAAATENYGLLHPGETVPTLVAKEPQIDQAQAQLAAAKAREQIAILSLSRTRFSLPFDGWITESSVESGQLIAPGQTFGRAFANDAVEASVPVATPDLYLISPAVNRQATITVDNRQYAAVVDRVAAELDGQSRFARIFLRITEDNDIPPGAFVHVSMLGLPLPDSFVLPETARQINDSVWIISDGKLKRIQPEVLSTSSHGLIVKAFDYQDGIVLGSVPGAMDGLAVSGSTAQ